MTDIHNQSQEDLQEISYPDNCLRGISDSNFIGSDGTANVGLFQFKSDHKKNGWIEESINWEDDDQAVILILEQTKEDGKTLQFKAGYARISRAYLDDYCNYPSVHGRLTYGRDAKPDNHYHGNLLLREDVPELTRRRIAAGISSLVIDVVPR